MNNRDILTTLGFREARDIHGGLAWVRNGDWSLWAIIRKGRIVWGAY